MADEELGTESTEEQTEATDSPSPSTPSLVSPGEASAPPFDLDALGSQLVDKLRPMIVEEVSRKFQSGTDIRADRVDKIYQYLEAADGNKDEAIHRMKVDEIYATLDSETPGGTGGGGSDTNQAFMEARTGQLLRDAGIDFEDPDYKMLTAQYAGRITDPNQWLAVVEGFTGTRQTKQAKQENIPGAAAASEGGTVLSAAGDEDIDSLTAELNRLQALPATQETMAARSEIRKKLTAQHEAQGTLGNVSFDRN